jgi:hypothetical protein
MSLLKVINDHPPRQGCGAEEGMEITYTRRGTGYGDSVFGGGNGGGAEDGVVTTYFIDGGEALRVEKTQ